jgi:hypothetical protein
MFRVVRVINHLFARYYLRCPSLQAYAYLFHKENWNHSKRDFQADFWVRIPNGFQAGVQADRQVRNPSFQLSQSRKWWEIDKEDKEGDREGQGKNKRDC